MTQVIDKTNDIYKQAEEYIKNGKDFKAEGLSEYQNGKFNGYIDGRTEQKEQDKELIEGMLNVLRWIRNTDIGFNSLGKGTQLSIDDIIKKTEKHLNQ